MLWAPSEDPAASEAAERANGTFAAVEAMVTVLQTAFMQGTELPAEEGAAGLVVERWYGVKNRPGPQELQQIVASRPPDGVWRLEHRMVRHIWTCESGFTESRKEGTMGRTRE